MTEEAEAKLRYEARMAEMQQAYEAVRPQEAATRVTPGMLAGSTCPTCGKGVDACKGHGFAGKPRFHLPW